VFFTRLPKANDMRYVNKCGLMHIFNVAQFRCRHYVNFSVLLHSHVLTWISVGLFPPEEPSTHVTALKRLLLMLYPPRHQIILLPDHSRRKLNCSIHLLPTWKRTDLRFVRLPVIGASSRMNHRLQ
jgi:hypothetical protein